MLSKLLRVLVEFKDGALDKHYSTEGLKGRYLQLVNSRRNIYKYRGPFSTRLVETREEGGRAVYKGGEEAGDEDISRGVW